MKEDSPLVTEELKKKRQEIKSIEDVKLSLIESRYAKDSCTLEYFKNYLDRRKKKLTKESVDRLHQLDFHFNDDGYVYYEDVLRLAEEIIFNVKDLYEKGELANCLETYLDFKVTKKSLDETLKMHQDIYSKSEVQLLDSNIYGKCGIYSVISKSKNKIK